MNTETKDIPVDQIKPFISRARDKSGWQELRDSMADVGLNIPIQVKDLGRVGQDGKRYELICGQGRTEAAMDLGWKVIPALVVNVNEADFIGRFAAENLIRQEIPWVQKGRIIKDAVEAGKKIEDVAKQLHIKPDVAKRYLHVVTKTASGLEPEIQRMGMNLAEQLTSLPARGQKIVIQEARESGQKLKSVIEVTKAVAKKKKGEWEDVSKADIKKALREIPEQNQRTKVKLKVKRLHFAIGPLVLMRLVNKPAFKKRLEEEGVEYATAIAAINKAQEITV